jgi:hypothetical protein
LIDVFEMPFLLLLLLRASLMYFLRDLSSAWMGRKG